MLAEGIRRGLITCALTLAPLGAFAINEVVEIPVLVSGDGATGALPQALIEGPTRPGVTPNLDPATGEHPVYRLRPEPYSESGRKVVSLADLLGLAQDYNYGVRSQELSVESARYDVDKTYYVFDPTIGANVQYSKRNTGGARAAQQGGVTSSEGLSAGFDLTVPREYGDSFALNLGLDRSRFSVGGLGGGGATESPTTFGSDASLTYNRPLLRGAGSHLGRIPRYQASNVLELQEFTLDNRYQGVRKDILDAYFLAIASRRSIDVRIASLERALGQLERAVERYKVGLSIQADVLQAENSVLQQRAALLQSYEDYDTLLDQLTAIVGVPQSFAITVDPNEALLGLDEGYNLDLPQDLWDMVAGNSLELRGLATQLANLRLTRDRLEDAKRPQLDLQASVGRNGNDDNLGGVVTGLENQSYSIGLNWSSTPGERLAKADLAQNELERENLTLQIRDTELQLKTLLRDLQRDLSTKLQQIELAESNVLVTRQTLDIVTERANVGLATALDVIEAQEDVLVAELALLNAQVAYQQSYREILLLAGLI
jgi:outer membrane protein